MKKFTAFTLSEVLITIGILGVVSALTIPTLVNDYQKDANATTFRKIVTDFENATDMYITEEGKKNLAATAVYTSDSGVESFMTKLKTVSSNSGFADSYRSINGQNTENFSCGKKAYVLPNGAAVCLDKDGGQKSLPGSDAKLNPIGIQVYVDINGKAKPNIGGRDMFSFLINLNGQAVAYSSGICIMDPCKGMTDAEAKECQAENARKCKAFKACVNQPLGDNCITELRQNNWKMKYEGE